MKVLLSTAYWPNLQYFYYLLNSEEFSIEAHEHFQKQSFRNRTRILSANGKLDLIVPVQHHQTIQIQEVKIAFKEKWQLNHFRAISSAYKNSPYFDFFEEDVKLLYEDPGEKLLDFNLRQLKLLFKWLRINKKISLTNEYLAEVSGYTDLRSAIHPKKNYSELKESLRTLHRPYYQTFENKFPFQANLSILDLIFNKGLESLDHLASDTFTL